MTPAVTGRAPPLLTLAVAALTAVVGVVGLVSPPVTDALARTPGALHGQAWRWVTSLLVQDGGWVGTASNVVFLVLLGAAAERVVSRRTWVLGYLLAGLVGQLAGQFWQPYGAGNSVAVCGLAGLVAWRVARPELPGWTRPALAVWLGALLATWWPPLVVLGVLAAVVDGRGRTGALRSRLPLLAAALVAVVLVAVGNIHGAALAAGLLLVPRGRAA